MPADQRIGQQFLLEDDAELKWQLGIEDGNIQRGCVGHRVNMRFRSVDLVQSGYFHGRSYGRHDALAPHLSEAVQNALSIAKPRCRNRSEAKENRIRPNQGIEDQIRTQTARPAILSWFEGVTSILAPPIRMRADALDRRGLRRLAQRILADRCLHFRHFRPSLPAAAWPLPQCIWNP